MGPRGAELHIRPSIESTPQANAQTPPLEAGPPASAFGKSPIHQPNVEGRHPRPCALNRQSHCLPRRRFACEVPGSVGGVSTETRRDIMAQDLCGIPECGAGTAGCCRVQVWRAIDPYGKPGGHRWATSREPAQRGDQVCPGSGHSGTGTGCSWSPWQQGCLFTPVPSAGSLWRPLWLRHPLVMGKRFAVRLPQPSRRRARATGARRGSAFWWTCRATGWGDRT